MFPAFYLYNNVSYGYRKRDNIRRVAWNLAYVKKKGEVSHRRDRYLTPWQRRQWEAENFGDGKTMPRYDAFIKLTPKVHTAKY